MKVLWLASWYPDELSPLSGDFIKRHAEAVCLYEQVHVIYVVRDALGKITKSVYIAESCKGNLKETIVYYHNPKVRWAIIDKLLSEFKYRRLFKKQIKKCLKQRKPDLVHVHVGMKAGNLARWIKRKYAIPFVITEHWTGLLQEAEDNLDQRSFFWKNSWKTIAQEAAEISAVSAYLAKAIKEKFFVSNCIVIPNVVDTTIFSRGNYDPEIPPVKLLHVSTFDDFKNIFLILEAFKIALEAGFDSRLTLVGPKKEDISSWIDQNGLQDKIVFFAEMPQHKLADVMRANEALIIYSKYETFRCVIVEANACGIPVIVSDIPVMREIIEDGVNGFFAPPQNAEALAAVLIKFIHDRPVVNKFEIAQRTASKYSYSVVGKVFSDWYIEVLNKIKAI